MPSILTIKERINNASERNETTLNLSFKIKEIESMMKFRGIKETDGTDKLSRSIVEKILEK